LVGGFVLGTAEQVHK